MAELSDVIQQLKENNESTINVEKAVDSLSGTMEKLFIKSLEERREEKDSKPSTARAAPTQVMKKQGVGAGLSSMLNKFPVVGALAAFATVLGTGIMKAGVGIGAAATGLGAFFKMLASANEQLTDGGEQTKKLLTNVAAGISAFSDRDLKAFGTLLLGGALFGALPSVIPGLKGVGAGIGIAAVGAGIAGFFSALSAGDMAIDKMESTGENLSKFMKNIADGLRAFSDRDMIAIGALLGGTALFSITSKSKIPGYSGIGAGIGIVTIGAGIAGFISTLAASDKVMNMMNTKGENLSAFLKNIAAGLSAFSNEQLFGAAGILAASPLFGLKVVAGKSIVGLTAIGTAISGFVSGLGLGDILLKGASLIGADGSNLKTFLTNIAEGLKPFGELGDRTLKNVLALGASGFSVLSLLGGTTVGRVTDTVIEGFRKLGDLLFGTNNAANTEMDRRKTYIAGLVDALKPLEGIKTSAINNLTLIGRALNNFANSVQRVAEVNFKDFKENFKDLAISLAGQLEVIDKLANGGVLKGKKGFFFDDDDIDFGKGLADPSLKLDQLDDLINKARNVLGFRNITRVTNTPLNKSGQMGRNNNPVGYGNVDRGSGNNIINAPTTNNKTENYNSGMTFGSQGINDPYDQMLLN